MIGFSEQYILPFRPAYYTCICHHVKLQASKKLLERMEAKKSTSKIDDRVTRC